MCILSVLRSNTQCTAKARVFYYKIDFKKAKVGDGEKCSLLLKLIQRHGEEQEGTIGTGEGEDSENDEEDDTGDSLGQKLGSQCNIRQYSFISQVTIHV